MVSASRTAWALSVALGATALVLHVSDASAQQACTYEQCALRLEEGNILAGRESRPIGRLGFLDATDMSEVFAASDSAAAHYRAFHSNYVAGSALGLVSTITLGGWWFFRKDLSTRSEVGFALTGIVTSLLATRYESRADRALSRAIWWYNRDLPR